MTEPLEIERKFEVLNFDRSMLPKDAVELFIVQDYLIDDGSGTRRIRETTEGDVVSYDFTTKRPTGKRGTRVEIVSVINEEEYEALLEEKDEELMTVKKFRYKFPYNNRVVELDVMLEPLYISDRVFLEVEVPNIDEEVILPPEFEVVERTDDNRYSNYSIAAGIIPENS